MESRGKAEPLYLHALEARERVLGRNHPDTLTSVNNLAILYHKQGRYSEAEPLLVRALETSERVLGQDHPDTLTSINNLAVLYEAQGRYSEAEPLYLRALQSSERILGQDHLQTLLSIGNLAVLYHAQGRYDEAEPLSVRALKARERVLGQDHPDTLTNINNLAELYREQGRYDEAEPLHLRALKARERILGRDHPDTLSSVHNLAGLYEAQGRYGKAESLYLRALQSSEWILGQDHPQTLTSINNLAVLYHAQGRYDEAEPLLVRALETHERVLGQDHPDTLSSIHNLAGLYRAQGRYSEAEPLYLRALEASERILGRDHPDTIASVNNLAELYQVQGRYSKAEPLFVRALETRERILGRDHPDTLISISSLAWLYFKQGHYDEAEPLYVRALETSERILGQNHPHTLAIQLNLAVTFLNNRQRDRAMRELRRMDGRLRHFVGAQLTTTHRERIRRRWLRSKFRFQDVIFSLALQHPAPENLRLAADVLLRWKRLAGETETLTAQLVRSSQDPRVVKLAKELSRRRADLSRLVNLPVPDGEAAITARKNDIATTRAEVERLEIELAGRSQAFQDYLTSRTLDWRQIRSELPRNSALLSLRAFRPVDFATEAFGEPHWLAFLIPAEPGDGPELLLRDLGPIALTKAMHKELRDTSSKESAQMLYRRLFGKLDIELAKYERLYIAADGLLDLVAFARLVVPDGRYWVQRQALHQIRTGRDLVQKHSGQTAAKGMLILGGVDYRRFPASGKQSPPPVGTQEETTDQLLAMNRRLHDERGGFGNLKFTAGEAKKVGQFYEALYGQAHIWQARSAAESRLKNRLRKPDTPPRILHLATHGFFFPEKAEHTERPMTLGGLALAGANAGMQGQLSPAGQDGVLYALEVQDLNLEGTELVTLSACDTGRGEVDYSEGVYGLVRAFRIAGARHLLMTLWTLNDALAEAFMRDFYANWFQDPKRHPAVALRKTQLAWIHDQDPKRRDPQYWAPYVLIEGR